MKASFEWHSWRLFKTWDTKGENKRERSSWRRWWWRQQKTGLRTTKGRAMLRELDFINDVASATRLTSSTSIVVTFLTATVTTSYLKESKMEERQWLKGEEEDATFSGVMSHTREDDDKEITARSEKSREGTERWGSTRLSDSMTETGQITCTLNVPLFFAILVVSLRWQRPETEERSQEEELGCQVQSSVTQMLRKKRQEDIPFSVSGFLSMFRRHSHRISLCLTFYVYPSLYQRLVVLWLVLDIVSLEGEESWERSCSRQITCNASLDGQMNRNVHH